MTRIGYQGGLPVEVDAEQIGGTLLYTKPENEGRYVAALECDYHVRMFGHSGVIEGAAVMPYGGTSWEVFGIPYAVGEVRHEAQRVPSWVLELAGDLAEDGEGQVGP